ncbi:P-loop containing nucleoside triphosphate hydrolase protein [Zopfochytrium polystomum]|nr:P-loop containing nucleoside triphosphate hydrolase protein [Zopfochytrium polystomum]
MILTKKLIEVRNLLKTVNVQNSNLKLPSIVVVGSQSSGKSSVLEAIVGHEFLPKGNNMVTRRPIELTLIHNPNSSEEYSEFPQLGFGKITDFGKVQKTLTDLNLAVPDSECVSPVPIELRIYSPNVPDLTMVDLPGYIQIHNKNQPAILKEKIADLCESYIKDTNIILAVCAADVDLANSEALRASRKVDPLGTRTIGVITKMDLVDPERAVSILQNSDYPLKLGYVGVICKTKASSGPSQAVIRAEDAYFKANPIFRGSQVTVGTPTLRRRLMEVLEEQMGRGLHRVVDAVQAELDEARYQFKVQYDDRRVSPESYVAEVMDSVKGRFREFARTYGKQQVKEQVREMLEEKLLDLCADVYWSDAMQTDAFTKVCGDPIWVTRVDMVASQLAKSGVGRSSVQVVADTLLNTMDQICSEGVSKYHPSTRAKLMQFSNDLIRSKFNQTVDQVENTIRPFKMEVDCSEGEWKDAQKRAVALFDRKIAEAHTEINTIKSTLGRRKLRTLLKQIQTALRQQQDSGADTMDTTGIDPAQLALGQRYLHLTHHTSLLQRRHAAIRSRACSTTTPGKSCCPETFLSAVVEKLTHHAVLFISVELVNEFFFQIPRDMDAKLYYELSRQEIKEFAKENEAVAKHLEVQERKETLELVMQKLRGLSSRH